MSSTNRRQRSVEWQNRYLTPVFLIAAVLAVALVWAVGAIAWWLAVLLLAFGVATLVGVIRRQDS